MRRAEWRSTTVDMAKPKVVGNAFGTLGDPGGVTSGGHRGYFTVLVPAGMGAG